MANTILEARAVITAEDRTAAAFAAIESKIAGLTRSARVLGDVTKQVATVAKAVDPIHRAVGRGSPSSGLLGAMGQVGGFAAAHLGAVVGGGLVAHEAIKASAARAHERVRMEVSGMSRAEIAEAENEAAKLAREFPSVGQTETLHMLRNARAIVGSYKEAAEIAEPLAKLRVIAQGARPGADVSEDFDQLVKGLEIKGVTQHPEQFRSYMQGIAKALNVFGDTLKPYQYYEMFKYGRQATPGLSERFILGTAPTLAQELGGSSYGKAVAAFNSSIVSGVMKHASVKEFERLGLVNADSVIKTKTGDIKGLKPGGIAGWTTAQSDPNAWVRDVLLPAMRAKGIVTPEDTLREIGALFQNQTAAQMVGLLATQQSRIDKDYNLIRGAKGLDAADDYAARDPHVAFAALKNTVEGLLGTLGESTMKALIGPMNDVAKAVGGYTQRLTEMQTYRDQHPDGPSLGQKKFNRLMNSQIGVDSDKAAGEDAQAEADAVYRKAVAGSEKKQAEYDRLRAEQDRLTKLRDGASGKPYYFWSNDEKNAPGQIARVQDQADKLGAELAHINEVKQAYADLQGARQAAADFARNLPTDMSKQRSAQTTVLPDQGMAAGAFPLAVPGTPGWVAPGWQGGHAEAAPSAPAPTDPGDRVRAALEGANITAKADVTGTVQGEATVKVEAGSDLIRIVDQARTMVLQGSLSQNTGKSAPEAAPSGQTGRGG